MTKGEAIDICMEVRDYLTSGNPIWNKDKVGEALDMAIEAMKKDETTLHVSGISPDRIVRAIDPTITVDLESGVVPISACEPKEPKTIIYADRPKGHWKMYGIYDSKGRRTGEHAIICDRCLMKEIIRFGQSKWDFCPNCGADMRGEK